MPMQGKAFTQVLWSCIAEESVETGFIVDSSIPKQMKKSRDTLDDPIEKNEQIRVKK